MKKNSFYGRVQKYLILSVWVGSLVFVTHYSYAAEARASTITAQHIFDIKGDENNGGILNQPAGIALDKYGNVFVADTINHRIVVFDNAGKFKTSFGQLGQEPGKFNAPMALTIDKTNEVLYVADSSNYRVQVFKTNGEFLRLINLQKNLSEKEKKVRPIGIAVNQQGHIYVSDADNNYIRVYSSEGDFLFKFGGFGDKDGQMCIPVGLSIDNDNKVYVIDMNNSRLQVFDISGKFLLKVGTKGDTTGSFYRPKDVDVDSRGNIFVSDGANLVVQIFDPKGQFVSVIGMEKDADLQFAAPFGLAVDMDRLYVTDRWRNNVRVYSIQY